MTQPQWKIINGFENYEISNEGHIRKEDTKKIIKGSKNPVNGYNYVGLYINGRRYGKSVHRLVANSFLNHDGLTINHVVDHIDRDKLNNNVSNLRWTSVSINLRNRKINENNESGFRGISQNNHYWICQINDIIGKQQNFYFSKRLSDAKLRAIQHRKKLELEYNYL